MTKFQCEQCKLWVEDPEYVLTQDTIVGGNRVPVMRFFDNNDCLARWAASGQDIPDVHVCPIKHPHCAREG